MLQDTVVIEGEVSLINQIDGDPSLLSEVDGDPEVIIVEGGGQTYPHYHGDYTVTPSTTAQVLDTDGKVMDDDVTVNPIPSQYIIPAGTKTISENGTHDVAQYESAVVDVQGGITPTGTKQISIASNGTVTEDVTNYANAEITTNVPASAVDTGTKSINSNGTHDVVGYANASVNVPNSYSQSDEGKVVSNGALVAQTSDTVTANDTYDTTLINSLTVNVGGTDYLGQMLSNILQSYTNNSITSIPECAFRACTALQNIYGSNIVTIGYQAFYGCSGLLTVPNETSLTSIFAEAFRGCSSLTTIHCRRLSTLGGSRIFYGCTSLTTAVVSAVGDTTAKISTFEGCTSLQVVDLANKVGTSNFATNIANGTFNSCSNLKTIIIRKSTIASLGNTGAFTNSPFASGGSGGTIYIPKSLYDHLGDGTANDYQSATNWSTIYGYGTITWAKIEGSIYENAYADGTPISS